MSGRDAWIEIDADAEIQSIIQKLNRLPDQLAAPAVLKNTLNATARKVRKQMVTGVRERYAVTRTDILKKEDEGAPQMFDASASSMVATIRSRGPTQNLSAFKARPNTPTGAAQAQVLKNGTMKPLEIKGLKAFVVTFANEHSDIVQRMPPDEYSRGRTERATKYGKGADMTKIEALNGPAVPHMLGSEEVQSGVNREAWAVLEAELQRRIDKINAAT